MNKNILLLIGAGGLYWYVRNQNSQSPAKTTAVALNTGASSYVPATTATNTATTGSSGSWLNNAAGTIAQGTAIIKTGSAAWDTIKDALHLNTSAPLVADVTADSSGGGNDFWSGNYNYPIS